MTGINYWVVAFGLLIGPSITFAECQLNEENIDRVLAKGSFDRKSAREMLDACQAHGGIDYLLRRVARGDSKWISLAWRLRQHTDGGLSESIDYWLSGALLSNPQAVLEYGDLDKLAAICFDLSSEVSKAQVKEFTALALKSLEFVSEKALLQKRDACLGRLRQSMMIIEKQ